LAHPVYSDIPRRYDPGLDRYSCTTHTQRTLALAHTCVTVKSIVHKDINIREVRQRKFAINEPRVSLNNDRYIATQANAGNRQRMAKKLVIQRSDGTGVSHARGRHTNTPSADLDRRPPSSGRRSEFSGNFLCSYILLRNVKNPVCLSQPACLSSLS